MNAVIASDEELKLIKTGDLLLFSSKSIKNKWIKSFSCTRWTHVAIAVRIKIKDGDKGYFRDFEVNDTEGEGDLCILDMIGDESDYDVISDQIKDNFRITPIRNRFIKCYNLIAYRPLFPEKRPGDYLIRAKDFILKYHDAKFIYPNGIIEIWLGLPFKSKSKSRGYSCTMIVSKFLSKVLGINTTLYMSTSSFDFKEYDHPGSMLKYYYGPEKDIYIDYEEWHESLGPLLIFFILWLLFWFFTADRVFK